MATAYNTTITVYKGVPLVKGGTDVLYLSAAAAEGVLASYAAGTYSGYYFERENRRYVQIDETYGNLDDVNYLSFKNMSHGGKLYFAFVDHCVYINDNNTELEFTIDPFPTFLGDCEESDYVYVERNTPKTDTRGENLVVDYNIESGKNVFTEIARKEYVGTTGIVYYAGNIAGVGSLAGTNIKMGPLSAALLQDIVDHGGAIIGAYACPADWTTGAQQLVSSLASQQIAPFFGVGSFYCQKMNTGLYNKIYVTVSSSSRYYEPEEFANPELAEFQILKTMAPGPGIFVYPKNYRGVADNLAEGIFAKFPAIQIAVNAVYTQAQERIERGAQSAYSLIMGGLTGGLVGAALGGISSIGQSFVNEWATQFQPPTLYGHGEPITSPNFGLYVSFGNVHADSKTLTGIDNYLRYYGYAVGGVRQKSNINTDNRAFLQTKGDFLRGSEADDQLNARLAQGIKIRKILGTIA